MTETLALADAAVSNFGFRAFELVSNFEIRASSFYSVRTHSRRANGPANIKFRHV
jgi:hypothetical protein